MAAGDAVQRSSGSADETHWGACVGILAAVATCAVVGAAVDAWLARRRAANGAKEDQGLRCWALGTLISSYALLFPGLFLKLFESTTDLVVFGIEENMSTYDVTMELLIRRLWREGMPTGAILVALYSMAIPGLKILLLAVGLALRRGSARQVGWARLCIRVVQAISKWACPDMFAYILLTYLMRGLNRPPTIKSTMELELGFTCFCVFCIASTASTLGIPVPELPNGDVEDRGAEPAAEAADAKAAALQAAPHSHTRCSSGCCRGAVLPVILLLSVSFFTLLAIGLRLPSMSLQLDMSLLYKERPGLAALKAVLDHLDLEQLLHKEVGVWQCMLTLVTWMGDGEVNAVIAFVLYAVFAVLLPIVDMCLTLWIAAILHGDGSASAWQSSAPMTLALSQKVQKLAMLDVSIMGCFIVVAALASQRKHGVIVEARAGCALLIGAEVCRQLASLIVRRVLSSAASAQATALEATTITTSGTDFSCADHANSQNVEILEIGVGSASAVAVSV